MNVRNTPTAIGRSSGNLTHSPQHPIVGMFARVATFQTPGGTPGQIPGERRRALIVDDEAVFRTLITSAVSDFGFEARAIGSAHELADALEEFDPDIVMLDLALGEGPNGLDLLEFIEKYYPWVSVLILTSFRSPELVGTLDGPLNPKVGYVVKSDVVDLDVLRDAIEQTLASEPPRRAALAGVPVVTRGQAEVLRLMAEGLSNAAIAQRRGCSARALERIIARLYTALGISDDAQGNARVQAVTVFRDGGVDVR